MKLNISEQKKLRFCSYQASVENTWVGHTDGEVYKGLYIKVYPAHYHDGKKWRYKKTNCIYVPLTSVFYFWFFDLRNNGFLMNSSIV